MFNFWWKVQKFLRRIISIFLRVNLINIKNYYSTFKTIAYQIVPVHLMLGLIRGRNMSCLFDTLFRKIRWEDHIFLNILTVVFLVTDMSLTTISRRQKSYPIWKQKFGYLVVLCYHGCSKKYTSCEFQTNVPLGLTRL